MSKRSLVRVALTVLTILNRQVASAQAGVRRAPHASHTVGVTAVADTARMSSRSTSAARTGLFIGAAAGLGIGLWAGHVMGDNIGCKVAAGVSECDLAATRRDWLIAGAVAGTVVGGVVGGIVGAVVEVVRHGRVTNAPGHG